MLILPNVSRHFFAEHLWATASTKYLLVFFGIPLNISKANYVDSLHVAFLEFLEN